MRIEINDNNIKCELRKIRNGDCFLSPKNEICIKTKDRAVKPMFDDPSEGINFTKYFYCVNLMNGEVLEMVPDTDVIPLNLKVVEE